MKTFGVSGTDKFLLNKAKIMGKSFGLKLSSKPNFVIAIGGHGTFYYAEKKFPGIPKLIIRNENIDDLENAILKISKGRYIIEDMTKLEVSVKGKKLQAINDIVIRNKKIYHAIRFDLFAKKKYKNIISDGVIVATPYGSSGYFYSASGKKFKNGIGLVINNPTSPMKPILLGKKSKIEIKVNREAGEVTADSIKKVISVKAGDKITVKVSKKVAKMVKVSGKDLFRRR